MITYNLLIFNKQRNQKATFYNEIYGNAEILKKGNSYRNYRTLSVKGSKIIQTHLGNDTIHQNKNLNCARSDEENACTFAEEHTKVIQHFSSHDTLN